MTLEFQNHVSTALGRIEQKIDDLSGPHGRVTKVEEKVKWAEDKQWFHTVLIIPITTALAALIRHFTK